MIPRWVHYNSQFVSSHRCTRHQCPVQDCKCSASSGNCPATTPLLSSSLLARTCCNAWRQTAKYLHSPLCNAWSPNLSLALVPPLPSSLTIIYAGGDTAAAQAGAGETQTKFFSRIQFCGRPPVFLHSGVQAGLGC